MNRKKTFDVLSLVQIPEVPVGPLNHMKAASANRAMSFKRFYVYAGNPSFNYLFLVFLLIRLQQIVFQNGTSNSCLVVLL